MQNTYREGRGGGDFITFDENFQDVNGGKKGKSGGCWTHCGRSCMKLMRMASSFHGHLDAFNSLGSRGLFK